MRIINCLFAFAINTEKQVFVLCCCAQVKFNCESAIIKHNQHTPTQWCDIWESAMITAERLELCSKCVKNSKWAGNKQRPACVCTTSTPTTITETTRIIFAYKHSTWKTTAQAGSAWLIFKGVLNTLRGPAQTNRAPSICLLSWPHSHGVWTYLES